MSTRKVNPLYGKFNDLVDSLVEKRPDDQPKPKFKKAPQKTQRSTYSAGASQKTGQD
ncbi:MAG: hypothetical protein M2R45_04081 [Verrucomicrobia subdivision 3 bacterium]|nr:hypothetical protein [Limisphaerales bacterium]MCS1417020.1 hypothetical protein [Limisphaerales bacterium]